MRQERAPPSQGGGGLEAEAVAEVVAEADVSAAGLYLGVAALPRRLRALREEAALAEAALEAEWMRLCAAEGREELAADKRGGELRERESALEAEERKYNA